MIKYHNANRAIFYGVLSLLLLTALTGPKRGLSEVVDRIVAVVNEDIIVLSELNEALKPYQERIQGMRYSPAEERAMLEKVRSEILNQLIEQKLTEQEIQRHELSISEAEVDRAITGFKQTYNINEDELREMLRRDGMTMADYRQHIRNQILRSMLVNREVKSRIVITRTDVEKHYRSHPELYGGSLQYQLKHILVRVPSRASRAEKERLYTTMLGLQERIKTGSPFDEVMLNPGIPEAMGSDLGLFEPSALAPEIQRALAGLDVGDLTDIIETDHGYQLFQIANQVQTDPRPLEEVAAEIEDQLYRDIVDQRFEQWLTELRNRSHIRIMEAL